MLDDLFLLLAGLAILLVVLAIAAAVADNL
jgi:hypothetical protein